MNDSKTSDIELLPDRVIKRFCRPEDFYRELEVYRLNLCVTPRLLEYREPEWIAIQRVEGLPYMDLAEGFDPILLAQTIAILHEASTAEGLCLCHVDNQPANILWDGSRYILLDFADSRMDHPESDISHLLLFWAEEYAPQKFASLAAAFLKAYLARNDLKPERWTRCLEQSRSRFYTRRAMYSKASARLPNSQREANQLFLDGLLG